MKNVLKLSILFFLLFCTTQVFSQTANDTTSSYAIVQVIAPSTTLGSFKINILYGNNNIELFKEVKFKDNRAEINNYAVDAMNILSKKGYVLINCVNADWGGVPYVQYVMYKK
jgi:hypothetical protein